MIPRPHIAKWQQHAPWKEFAQVEQDLIVKNILMYWILMTFLFQLKVNGFPDIQKLGHTTSTNCWAQNLGHFINEVKAGICSI